MTRSIRFGRGSPSIAGCWPSRTTASGRRICRARVTDLENGRQRIWLIVDQALQNGTEGDRIAAQLDGWGSRATDSWFGRFHVVGYVSYQHPEFNGKLPGA